MRTLYFECYSGISGDMTVASLLDLGADKEVLLKGLASLKVEGYDIKISRVNKSGIDACDFDVVLHHDHSKHTHAHVEHNHTHDHDHAHDHSHDDHSHDHDHEHIHHHEHRGLNDILEIIDNSSITDNAKAMASKIFGVIARAEAEVHGVPIEEIHFHEVGAVDSIVDIVGAAICIDNLKVNRIITSTVFEGTGYVRCQHGLMPVPAPATAKIMGECGIPMKITENRGEMVTPTGAGILAALCDGFKLPDNFTIEKSGFGAGKKEFISANVLRTYIINECDIEDEGILKLETNVDDMTGEELSYAMEKLFNAGARDVYFTPIYMKKNRPATMISVLCKKTEKDTMCELLFKHTSTIGVRIVPVDRITMDRTIETVSTSLGNAEIKTCSYKGFTKKTIEFESAKRISEEKNLTISEVCTKIRAEVN